jgi:tRNA 2-selenouridine synthase
MISYSAPMSVTKLNITEFLQLAPTQLVLDVRSPGEYAHAHLPGAHSLPLFTDTERAITGTAYKQQSRETAIKIGLDFFGPKMRPMVEETERLLAAMVKKQRGSVALAVVPEPPKVLVHCWRGGMRSAGVAWLLDLYGFRVYTLEGGYKAYRNWVLQQFDRPYNFRIIGGYTGSGKTPLLHALARTGHATIDLEALANHKGSALGGINQPAQPSQELFENQLAMALFAATASDPDTMIFLEDESQRIGNMQLPMPLWRTMQRSPVYFLDIPFAERLTYLTGEYGRLPKEKLVNAIIRIQKRLGGLETKTAIAHLVEDNHRESFRVLLKYYDKWYAKGLYGRDNADALIHKIDAGHVDAAQNLNLLTQLINAQC